jgi:D-proline reductase (dithiol) PrdB
MRVDSYRFLPRSFRPLYQDPPRLPGEDAPAWAPATARLAETTVALLTSAGLYAHHTQAPFDLERDDLPAGDVAMAHLHLADTDILADPEIVLPAGALDELVAEGVVGAVAPEHVSVMGYQEHGLAAWRDETAPAIVAHLAQMGAGGLVLAPA